MHKVGGVLKHSGVPNVRTTPANFVKFFILILHYIVVGDNISVSQLYVLGTSI